MSPRNTDPAFVSISSQFDGVSFTDAELLTKRFSHEDPRLDVRYAKGAPPEGVKLVSFDYFYEVEKPPEGKSNSVHCMFGNHPHRQGGAFLFSDGNLRCMGIDCFQELATATGKDIGQLQAAFTSNVQRRGALMLYKKSIEKLSKLLELVNSRNYIDQCAGYDAFNDYFRSQSKLAYSFCLKLAEDEGNVLISRHYDFMGERKSETTIAHVAGWKAFRSVPKLMYVRSQLALQTEQIIKSIPNTTEGMPTRNLKDFRNRVEALEIQDRDISDKIRNQNIFRKPENFTQFCVIWNNRATVGYEIDADDVNYSSVANDDNKVSNVA